MLITIPFTTLVALLMNCGSILCAPGLSQNSTSQTYISRRQATPANQNAGKNLSSGAGNSGNMAMAQQMKMNGSPVPMSTQDMEAQEEAEEKKPGLNTIANAMNELYFHAKYGSQRNEPAVLLKMVGQAAGSTGKSADPEVVAKAMLATFEVYNQGKPSSISTSAISPLNKTTPAIEESPSLKTIAHTLHETWEKLISANPRPDNAQLVPAMCQAISSSSANGDPTAVSKAIDAAYAKIVGN